MCSIRICASLFPSHRADEIQGDILEIAEVGRAAGQSSMIIRLRRISYVVSVMREYYRHSKWPYLVNAAFISCMVICCNAFMYRTGKPLNHTNPKSLVTETLVELVIISAGSLCRTANARGEYLPLALVWVLASGALYGSGVYFAGLIFPLVVIGSRDPSSMPNINPNCLIAGVLFGVALSLLLKLRRINERAA